MGNIDKDKLCEFIAAGKTQVEAANYFNVSASAVCKMVKRLGLEVTKVQLSKGVNRAGRKPSHVPSSQAVDLIRTDNLQVIEQLSQINKDANTLLSGAMAGLNAVNGNKAKEFDDLFSAVDYLQLVLGAKDTALKSMAEIRGQLKLQLDIFQTLYDIKAIEEFQKEVVDAIGEVAPDVKQRIIDKLRQRRAIYAAIG